jgi:hypothetical protein
MSMWERLLSSDSRSALRSVFLAALLVAVSFTSGCGSGGMTTPSGPTFSGNTTVTVVLSSTANGQLSNFGMGLKGISLTNQAGATVNLLSATDATLQRAEFIHLNGGAEPLLTVNVPQGIYTAATVSVGDSYFTCVTLTPSGGLVTSTFAYGSTPSNAPATNVTVVLPSPITVMGDAMGLSLNLEVAQSATYSTCYAPNGSSTYAITPTFSLTPIVFSSQPTSARNGKVMGLNGAVTAIDVAGNRVSLSLSEPNIENTRTLSVSAAGSTVYQGISKLSGLAIGMLVTLDGAIQADGSVLATRVAVENPSAVDVLVGPTLFVSPNQPSNPGPSATFFSLLSEGRDQIPISWPYDTTSATYQISGQLTNLQTLPFTAEFNGTNMVAGQNVHVASLTLSSAPGFYSPATTLTLMPQTINGTVTGTSQNGKFAIYSFSLPAYDLFPTLAVQQGQTSLLNQPNDVEVYVDENTQMVNTQALAAGSTLRFYGLVFNDNGTLRMDCSQVNDGVADTSQATTVQKSGMAKGVVTQSRGSGGRLLQTIHLITSKP